jgi:hypothetical protein
VLLTAHPCGIHQLLAKTVNEIDNRRYGNKFLWSLVWWDAERCQYQAVHTTEGLHVTHVPYGGNFISSVPSGHAVCLKQNLQS